MAAELSPGVVTKTPMPNRGVDTVTLLPSGKEAACVDARDVTTECTAEKVPCCAPPPLAAFACVALITLLMLVATDCKPAGPSEEGGCDASTPRPDTALLTVSGSSAPPPADEDVNAAIAAAAAGAAPFATGAPLPLAASAVASAPMSDFCAELALPPWSAPLPRSSAPLATAVTAFPTDAPPPPLAKACAYDTMLPT